VFFNFFIFSNTFLKFFFYFSFVAILHLLYIFALLLQFFF